jgi:hypothetical protein
MAVGDLRIAQDHLGQPLLEPSRVIKHRRELPWLLITIDQLEYPGYIVARKSPLHN